MADDSLETRPVDVGITVGKFYPLHAGHVALLRTAVGMCRRLVVLVDEREGQQVSGETITGWVRDVVPSAAVVIVSDDIPDAAGPWAACSLNVIRNSLGLPDPSVAFTGEDYGDHWAAAMGCRHVRVTRSIAESETGQDPATLCGTRLRKDLASAPWQILSPLVRSSMCRRVVLLGAESTGTSTLAQALAVTYQTAWVPEYGRMYWEGRQHTHADRFGDDDMEFCTVAEGQAFLEDKLSRQANRVLFCDTDVLTTTLWHRRYANNRRCPSSLEALVAQRRHLISLYILTSPDIPFVQDGTRESGDLREQMHAWFVEALEKNQKTEDGCGFVVVSGTHEERLHQARNAIGPLLHWGELHLPDLPVHCQQEMS